MQVLNANSQYLGPQRTLSDPTFEEPRVGIGGNQNQDKVPLSPQAMREFKKLAAHAGPASSYLPKVNVLNNADAHKVGYSAWATNFRDTYAAELGEYRDKLHTSPAAIFLPKKWQ